jgi:hypothetical protein
MFLASGYKNPECMGVAWISGGASKGHYQHRMPNPDSVRADLLINIHSHSWSIKVCAGAWLIAQDSPDDNPYLKNK